jgi:DNA-binding LytR/AlgR family response regulator
MKTPKFLQKLSSENICYLEASLNYTLFYMDDGKTMISGYTIKVFETLFQNQDFIKINRSKLVNVAFIKKTIFSDNIYSVQLANGQKVNIARRRVNKIKELHPSMF